MQDWCLKLDGGTDRKPLGIFAIQPLKITIRPAPINGYMKLKLGKRLEKGQLTDHMMTDTEISSWSLSITFTPVSEGKD